MTKDTPRRRMIENELVFRKRNEQVKQGFDKIKRLAEKEGRGELLLSDDPRLFFYCECSDENCLKRISMKLSFYGQVHKKRDYFVVAKNHEVAEIEDVVERYKSFVVVQKKTIPPGPLTGLKQTPVHNV